jgi:flagellar hook-basal body complex protein FliE
LVDEIRFTPLRPVQPPGPGQAGGASGPGKSSFQDVLKDALQEIDRLQHRATESVTGSFNPADPTDLHQVMIAMEEANIAFQFAMEVRNQLVDGYNELLRMSV